GIEHRRGVDGDLVGAGIEHGANIIQGTDTAAHCQLDEYLTGNEFDRMHGGIAALVTGGNVEEGALVGACITIATRDLRRISGIADVQELDALDVTTLVAVQARNG